MECLLATSAPPAQVEKNNHIADKKVGELTTGWVEYSDIYSTVFAKALKIQQLNSQLGVQTVSNGSWAAVADSTVAGSRSADNNEQTIEI